MQYTPGCSVSHCGAARRVALVQFGRRMAVAPPRGPCSAPLHPRASRCATGHHRRKFEYCRDCVGEQSDDGDDNVRADCRLEHRSSDEHGEPALPNGCARDNRYCKADVQRRHQQMERCERVKHVPGNDYAAYSCSHVSPSLSTHMRKLIHEN
jgi:hypothetical protein